MLPHGAGSLGFSNSEFEGLTFRLSSAGILTSPLQPGQTQRSAHPRQEVLAHCLKELDSIHCETVAERLGLGRGSIASRFCTGSLAPGPAPSPSSARTSASCLACTCGSVLVVLMTQSVALRDKKGRGPKMRGSAKVGTVRLSLAYLQCRTSQSERFHGLLAFGGWQSVREEKWRACVGLLPALRRNADVAAFLDGLPPFAFRQPRQPRDRKRRRA